MTAGCSGVMAARKFSDEQHGTGSRTDDGGDSASIRRIISDDEASSTQQRATSSEYAEQVRVEDADYEAADTQMIADIERALGSVRGAAEPAPVDDDLDDILDLTEPGGTSPEDVMMADEPITVLRRSCSRPNEIYEEPRPKLDFSTAFPPSEPPAEMAESLTEAVDELRQIRASLRRPEPAYEEPAPTYDEPVATFVEETVMSPRCRRASRRWRRSQRLLSTTRPRRSNAPLPR